MAKSNDKKTDTAAKGVAKPNTSKVKDTEETAGQAIGAQDGGAVAGTDGKAAPVDTAGKADTTVEKGDKPAATKGDTGKDTGAPKPESGKAKATRQRIAKELFKAHGEWSELHFTSDGIPFKNKPDALKHSATLADKTIITETKDE